jgi:5-methylcytosine-specific restriction enzyme A
MNPELVNKNHVLQAITEFDRLGRDAFLKKYDFGKSKQYLLLHKEKNYDSKPIYGVAHGFATDDFLTAKDFSGGLDHAAGYLVDLGFNVPEPVQQCCVTQVVPTKQISTPDECR